MKQFKRRSRKQYLFITLLLCSSIVAALLLCEAALRLAPSYGYYIWPPHFKKVFQPAHDIMPGISGEKRLAINSHGIRGDEPTPAHTYRILALGGSTTECLALDQSETWSYIVQKIIN